MNSLYQQLNQGNSLQNNQLGQIKQMMSLLKGNNNPSAMMNLLANNNPQLRQIMSMVNSSGKSPKQLFYEMAQQRGIDPNQIINMLK